MNADALRAKVTVIIPTFGREDLVARAARSVVSQTFQDWSLLIVDDAFTPPITLPNDLAGDPRIRLVRLAKNSGAGPARNVGVGEARSEWVAFLDSDDEWAPERLGAVMAFLDQRDHDILVSNFLLKQPDGHAARHLPEWITPRGILFGCHCSPGSTMVVRRQAFLELGGFDPSLRRLEDWDLLIRWWSVNDPIPCDHSFHVTVTNLASPSLDRVCLL